MTLILAYAFVKGDSAGEGRQSLAMPWGSASLVDLYVGYFLFAAWILYRNGITLPSVLWIVATMTLGSLAICVYVLVSIRTTEGNWHIFFMSRHARPSV